MISVIAGLALMGSGKAEVTKGCPYLPAYVRLQHEMRRSSRSASLSKLYAYVADPEHENPAACEATDIDAAISEQELALVSLHTAKGDLHPWAGFHCFKYNPITTQCQGTVEDGTGQPDYVKIRPPRTSLAQTSGRILSSLSDARLIAVYSTVLSNVLDGKRAKLLGANPAVHVPGGTVLIAIFTAPGRQWHYRKFVWYL